MEHTKYYERKRVEMIHCWYNMRDWGKKHAKWGEIQRNENEKEKHHMLVPSSHADALARFCAGTTIWWCSSYLLPFRRICMSFSQSSHHFNLLALKVFRLFYYFILLFQLEFCSFRTSRLAFTCSMAAVVVAGVILCIDENILDEKRITFFSGKLCTIFIFVQTTFIVSGNR